jgi:hypothetical protein
MRQDREHADGRQLRLPQDSPPKLSPRVAAGHRGRPLRRADRDLDVVDEAPVRVESLLGGSPERRADEGIRLRRVLASGGEGVSNQVPQAVVVDRGQSVCCQDAAPAR